MLPAAFISRTSERNNHREFGCTRLVPADTRGIAMAVLPLSTMKTSSTPGVIDEHLIDLVHLARTTLGDGNVDRELLAAFGLRAGMLMLRMQQQARSTVYAATQALKNSARVIGAWRLVS